MKEPWRLELTYILMSAMEAAWLSPVLLLISFWSYGPQAVIVGLPLCVLLYLFRYLACRLVDSRLDVGRSRLLFAYLIAASLLIALKIQTYPTWSWLTTDWLRQAVYDITHLGLAFGSIALTVATVVYAWWRAVQVTVERSHLAYVFQQFQIGLVAVALSTFLAGRAGYPAIFSPYIFWFFLWGLAAVGVARLEETTYKRRGTMEPLWLFIVGIIALIVLCGGAVVSAVYSRDIMAGILHLLEAMMMIIQILVMIIALPLGFLLEIILFVLRRLIRLGEMRPIEQPVNPVDSFLQQLEEMRRRSLALPPAVMELAKWLLIILVLATILIVLVRALRRFRPDEQSEVVEVHEFVWSRSELWGSLRALWQRLLAALRRGQRRTATRTAVLVTEEQRAAHTIRQIYARLMELAASLGRERPATSTPYEYLPDLKTLMPACQPDLTLITDVYVRARYGPMTAMIQDLAEAQQAWQRVRQEGARIQAEKAGDVHSRRAQGLMN